MIAEGSLLGEGGKDRYAKLGNRQSIFPRNKRGSIYGFFEEYRKFIEKDPEYYDPNLIAHKCTEEEIKANKVYDAVVVDEVQDLTESILGLILKNLKDENKGNFLLCGDVNQVVHPSFLSLSKLKSFLGQNKYVRDQGSEFFYTLEKNYRNSKQVIELANRTLHFKNYCFGPEDKMKEDEKKAFFMKSDAKNIGNVSLIAKDKEQKRIAKKVSGSTSWAVLVLDDESKKGVCELFYTPLVFNIHEAKGLEFENVILYKFISSKAYNEIWNEVYPEKDVKKIKGAIEKIRNSYQAGNVKTSQLKNKEDKSFEEYKFYMNALYVGISRAIDGVYIMDDEEKCNLLKVIKPNKIVSVDIKKEESSPEAWKNMALELIDKGNIEQAKNIATRLLYEGKKEHAQEIMNALETNGYHKDKSEQAILELKNNIENLSSSSHLSPKKRSTNGEVQTRKAGASQKHENKKHKNKQKPNESQEDGIEGLMSRLRHNEAIDKLKKAGVSQYDKKHILEFSLQKSAFKITEFLIKDKGFTPENSNFDVRW